MRKPRDTDYSQMSNTFFELYNMHRIEIDNLIDTAKTSLAGIVSDSNWAEELMPTPEQFGPELWVSESLFELAKGDAILSSKTIYLRWYYTLLLIAMGSLAAKKVIKYLNEIGDEAVIQIAGSGNYPRYRFRTVTTGLVEIRILKKGEGNTPWDNNFYYMTFNCPDFFDILDYCRDDDLVKNDQLKSDLPCDLVIVDGNGAITFSEHSIPLIDFGKCIKEQVIDRVKKIVADRG